MRAMGRAVSATELYPDCYIVRYCETFVSGLPCPDIWCKMVIIRIFKFEPRFEAHIYSSYVRRRDGRSN